MRAATGNIGLYIHIPFCRSKCLYCDFNSYAGASSFIPTYLTALEREANLWSPLPVNYNINTIYIGGGTPTLLNSQQITHLINIFRTCFSISPEAEITIEANPESTSWQLLRTLHYIGINRLSIGIQSFTNSELKTLGRPHSVADAEQAYRMAREAGFNNVNIDLIYGLPLQTLPNWHAIIKQAINLHPEHLSLYALTLETRTPLARAIACRSLPEPDPDTCADMYQLAEDILEEAGYHHYEISNWALPGRECRHNINYWKNGEYIGLGAGAHSHLYACRFANVDSPFEYERRLQQHEFVPPHKLSKEALTGSPWQTLADNGWPVDVFERLEQPTIMADTMILGLRLLDGIDLTALSSYLDQDIEQVYEGEISHLVADGLVEKERHIIRLSARGRLLSSEAFLRLLTRRHSSHRERSIEYEPPAQASL